MHDLCATTSNCHRSPPLSLLLSLSLSLSLFYILFHALKKHKLANAASVANSSEPKKVILTINKK